MSLSLLRGARPKPLPTATSILENVLAKLAEPDLSDEEAMKLWSRIGKAGKFDEVIAFFERRAEEQAESADAQTELGEAYLSKLRAGNISQVEMGTLGFKADAAFDRALALNDQHWDARFNKAVSLSFWPPVMGKQGEAIKHFEVLLTQQAGQSARPEHAATHLFLGNIYQQRGEGDKARAAWRRGAELFPESAELRQRLQNAGN